MRKDTNKNPSQEPEILPEPSNHRQMRRFSPTKEESSREARVESGKARETRTTESEGPPEEQRSMGIDSLPQNSLRRRSLSMEAVDGDPADRRT
ncbi:uncharacterized protein TNCV_1364221 [Trichonephila clavipes]|uniref:Uncharacterized protein n=1 Tax=Trichonephila clavipes TaxID=2585209 RepID=A0A8X6S131_TRICX|nr:uncharacterized protein TNCV_1364221 [Trichonephila clavipes]